MRYLVMLAAGAALAGCAPRLASGNAVGGIILNASTSKAKAFKAADAHCQKYGKSARVSGDDVWSDTMSFDCLAGTLTAK